MVHNNGTEHKRCTLIDAVYLLHPDMVIELVPLLLVPQEVEYLHVVAYYVGHGSIVRLLNIIQVSL